MSTTRVMVAGPARFDQVGQRLPSVLTTIDQVISAGLAQRLVRYATDRMASAGFAPLLPGASVEAYTLDGDDKPADRSYCVRWTRPEGGHVEVIGILTRAGWPSLDHGFFMGDRG